MKKISMVLTITLMALWVVQSSCAMDEDVKEHEDRLLAGQVNVSSVESVTLNPRENSRDEDEKADKEDERAASAVHGAVVTDLDGMFGGQEGASGESAAFRSNRNEMCKYCKKRICARTARCKAGNSTPKAHKSVNKEAHTEIAAAAGSVRELLMSAVFSSAVHEFVNKHEELEKNFETGVAFIKTQSSDFDAQKALNADLRKQLEESQKETEALKTTNQSLDERCANLAKQYAELQTRVAGLQVARETAQQEQVLRDARADLGETFAETGSRVRPDASSSSSSSSSFSVTVEEEPAVLARSASFGGNSRMSVGAEQSGEQTDVGVKEDARPKKSFIASLREVWDTTNFIE